MDLGAIGEEGIGCSVDTNKVFESGRHVRLRLHGIHGSLGALLPNVELGHGGTTMAKDTIVMGRSATKECISGNVLVPVVYVVGGKARTEVFAKWKTSRSMGKLSSMLNGCFDAIERYPAKIRTEKFQIGLTDGERAFLDDNFTAAFSENQVDIVMEIAGVLPSGHSPRVKIKSRKIVGSVQGKFSTSEFVVQRRRSPDSIRGEDNVWEQAIFIIGGWTHIHVGKSITIRERDVEAVRGDDALETASSTRSFVNESAKGLELCSGVNGVTSTIVGILVEDHNDRASVGVDESSSSNKRKILDGTLPHADDVGFVKVGDGDDFDIGTGHATIGAAVHKRTRDA